jgi:TonB family protein
MHIKKQSLFASLFLHLAVFSGVGLCLDFSRPALQQEGEKLQYIPSYLYQSNPKQPVSSKQMTAEKPAQKSLPAQKKTPPSTPTQTTASPDPSSPPPSSASGEKTEALLALLHQAIQNTQQYPATALQMGRQGRVQVGFRLFPDGRIRNLQLLQSCGTESLDMAALEAVRLAAPFQRIDTYIKAPGDFSIDVVFALADENA